MAARKPSWVHVNEVVKGGHKEKDLQLSAGDVGVLPEP